MPLTAPTSDADGQANLVQFHTEGKPRRCISFGGDGRLRGAGLDVDANEDISAFPSIREETSALGRIFGHSTAAEYNNNRSSVFMLCLMMLAARRVKTYYKKLLPGETFSLQITDSISMVPGEKYTFLPDAHTHEDFGQRSRYHDRDKATCFCVSVFPYSPGFSFCILRVRIPA